VVASDAGVEKAGSRDFADRQKDLFSKGFSFSGYERDLLALNLGGGKYLDVSGASGIDSITDGRGVVFADFDDDGDTDVFLTTIQGANHLLFRNDVGSRSGWLRIALEGKESGREAWNALVRVRTSAGTLTKGKACGSGYLAQSDPRLLFGLGGDAAAEWVEVTWPSGRRQRFEGLPARSSWRIVEGEERPTRVAEKAFSLPDPPTPGERSLAGLRVARGERFPAVGALTLEGDRTDVASAIGERRLTLLNLWATWCANCRREIPEIARFRESVGPERLEVIGLSLDGPGARERVAAFARSREIPYPVLVADEAAPGAIYASEEIRVPLSFLLDRDGRVLEVLAGWSPKEEARLREAIAEKRGQATFRGEK